MRLRALIPILAVLVALAFAASASAALQRPLEGTFGSPEPLSFRGTGFAVDHVTGDVLIGNGDNNSIERFHADGTPAPFAALGTNSLDGAEANGKPCAEEPASCDQTPENGINVPGFVANYQMTIDESGGPTDGDIYLTQGGGTTAQGFVDIFASDGRYLGQVTEAGTRPFEGENLGSPTGVAVDEDGSLYLDTTGTIYKYVPQPGADRVVNTDLTSTTRLKEESGYELGLGTGPTAGSLFVLTSRFLVNEGGKIASESILRLDKETGQVLSRFADGREMRHWFAVDRQNGNVLTGPGAGVGAEYEFPSGSEPVRVARLLIPADFRGGLAITPEGKVLVGEENPTAISVYGAPATVPDVTADPASGVTGTRATLTGTVDPAGGPPVTSCVFEYGKAEVIGGPFPVTKIDYKEHEVPCEGLDPDDPSSVHAAIEDLQSNGQLYGFRLVAFNENGQEETEGRTFTTLGTVVTGPATAIGLTKATLHGTVLPEGNPYTECFFQYGLLGNPVYEGTVPCEPGAAEIPANFTPQEVKAEVSALQGGSTYRFRLVATNEELGTVDGEEVTFTTLGLPTVGETRATGADQGSVTLEAKVDPRGFATSYDFEWGPTPAYGNLTPLGSVGGGTAPVLAQARIAGLAAGSTYHYRVVASNGRGTVRGPDRIAETLNSCGLPEGRCFELVSRKEAGPVAIPGESNAHVELHFQAATDGPGALAYPVESGYPEATKGADVLYRGVRGPAGWDSTQLSTPIVATNERDDGNSVSSATEWISDDLSCAFTDSTQPLTATPSMNLVREDGGSNLYRVNPDSTYTPVTTPAPENPEAFHSFPDYNVAGASQNCGVVLFTTAYSYPGLPTAAGAHQHFYEWREGTLRNAAFVPGPHGEVAVDAGPGASGVNDTQNAVSEDGSRFFFTAPRQTSPNPGEEGAEAVFVREGGSVTRDVSLSETSVPDIGAQYQWATADGSKVFFTANAGLTAESNSAGTDLYEYDLETDELTDRSLTSAEGGAQVVGFLGAAADGSRVYFASSNQLLSGSGNTRAQNLARHQYSIYTEAGGRIGFVGTANEGDRNQLFIHSEIEWTSQVSPDGRYLLFESSADTTGYESGGQLEAYLYDAEGGSGGTTCVSCRQDGGAPLERFRGYTPLARGIQLWNPLHPPRFLTMHDGTPQVFFSSPDVLAPGATAGQNNVYEWSHDQVFRLTSAPAGAQELALGGYVALFGGASEDGSDVYLITPETLNWEDGDERLSAYDARVGGGFPQPSPPPAACEATAEHQNPCMGPSQTVAGTPDPTSGGDTGARNFEAKKKSPAKKHKKAKHKKAKHRKHGKHKKAKHKKQAKRRPDGNRRNGK